MYVKGAARLDSSLFVIAVSIGGRVPRGHGADTTDQGKQAQILHMIPVFVTPKSEADVRLPSSTLPPLASIRSGAWP